MLRIALVFHVLLGRARGDQEAGQIPAGRACGSVSDSREEPGKGPMRSRRSASTRRWRTSVDFTPSASEHLERALESCARSAWTFQMEGIVHHPAMNGKTDCRGCGRRAEAGRGGAGMGRRRHGAAPARAPHLDDRLPIRSSRTPPTGRTAPSQGGCPGRSGAACRRGASPARIAARAARSRRSSRAPCAPHDGDDRDKARRGCPDRCSHPATGAGCGASRAGRASCSRERRTGSGPVAGSSRAPVSVPGPAAPRLP